MKKAKVITICGSFKFISKIMEEAERLSLEGNCVLSMIYTTKSKDSYSDNDYKLLGQMHFKKIEMSDAIFVVNINGYAFQSDHDDNPQPNTLEVKVNTATQTIESVAYVTFSDSKNIGDKTNSDVFLSQFVGVSIVDETASVDVVSGATITSQSVVKAVNAAIAAALD